MNRNVVFVDKSAYGTWNVYNFSGKPAVNDFLHCFDVWESYGKTELSKTTGYPYFVFECCSDFKDLLSHIGFINAFKTLGVNVVFGYKDVQELL